MNDFNEILKKYPIGTKLNFTRSVKTLLAPYYSATDLTAYELAYGNCRIVDNDYCEILKFVEEYNIVSGYLFVGNKWYPAEEVKPGCWKIIKIKEEPYV